MSEPPYYSGEELGINGRGVDCTTEFRAALDLLASKGGILQLPSGVISISDVDLDVLTSFVGAVTIRGAGINATRLDNGGTTPMFHSKVGCYWLNFEHMTVNQPATDSGDLFKFQHFGFCRWNNLDVILRNAGSSFFFCDAWNDPNAVVNPAQSVWREIRIFQYYEPTQPLIHVRCRNGGNIFGLKFEQMWTQTPNTDTSGSTDGWHYYFDGGGTGGDSALEILGANVEQAVWGGIRFEGFARAVLVNILSADSIPDLRNATLSIGSSNQPGSAKAQNYSLIGCGFLDSNPTGEPDVKVEINHAAPVSYGSRIGRLSLGPSGRLLNVGGGKPSLDDQATLCNIENNGRMSGVRGISGRFSSSVNDICTNFGGLVTATGDDAFVDVTLATVDFTNDYSILATPQGSTGTPAVGSNRVLSVTNKTTSAFRLNFEAAPGVGSTVGWYWHMQKESQDDT